MTKHLKALLLAFLVLAALVFFFANPLRNGEDVVSSRSLFNFKTEDVAGFQINNFVSGLDFKKDGETWLVKRIKNKLAQELEAKAGDGKAVTEEDKEYVRAKALTIAKFLPHLTTLTVDEPIAKLTDKPGLFEINEHSLHVIFFDKNKKELGKLYIGKQGPDLFSSFVKNGHSDDVYLVEENLRTLTLKEYEDWAEEKK
jgi:hypothetical protein